MVVKDMYKRMILDGLKERYPEYEFHMEHVTKNNGYQYEGIFAKLDESIPYAPIIPCEEYEEALASETMTIEQVLDEIDTLMQTRFPLKDIPIFDYEQIKERLRIRVINYEMNQKRLKDMPHKRFFDLAVICRIVIEVDAVREAGIVVDFRIMNAWGITEDELFEEAYRHTFDNREVRIRNLYDALSTSPMLEKEMDGVIPEKQRHDEWMYIADMNGERDGCICILQKEVFRRFAEEKGCDIYIIPSSIYELILVLSQEDMDWKFLRETLLEVHEHAVLQEEILSEHVYRYEREADEIVDLCEE